MKRNNFLTVLSALAVLAFLFVPKAGVSADATTTLVHLDIETSTTTLFQGDVNVSECSPGSGVASSTSAYCAIAQSGVANSWSAYGDDYFLDSIGGVGNDYTNSVYWGWFSDLNYGQTALNKHALTEGENLLVTLGKNPLKVSVSTSTPEVGATTTVTVTEFGFDASWNGIWKPAASSTLTIAGNAVFAATSTYDVVATSTNPIRIFAAKTGFITSPHIILSPITPAVSSGNNSNSNQGGSSRASEDTVVTAQQKKTVDVSAALNFLSSKQLPDGSFGSSLYTDWAAIACASLQASCAEKASVYLKTAPSPGSHATDYERRAMALMAVGIDPYSGTDINYIRRITDTFDGTQIGDSGLVNDDVFALFPLMKAGYSENDQIVRNTTAFIISRQQGNGSWEGSVDMTSAALQALSLVPSLDGVNAAKASARAFLASRQGGDGGFGSTFSTSWVMQAIAAIGEGSSSWQVSGNTPENFLASLQAPDGGMESAVTDASTRIWATSYALPAVLGRPWTNILRNFARPVVETTPATNPTQTIEATTIVATSTQVAAPKTVATTTPVIAATFATKGPVLSPAPETKKVSETKEAPAAAAIATTTATTSSGGEMDLAAASGGMPASLPIVVTGAVVVSLCLIALFIFKIF